METKRDEKTKMVSVTFTHVSAEKWDYLEKVAKTFNTTVGEMFGLFVNKLAATAGMIPPKVPPQFSNASRYSAVVVHLHKLEVQGLKVAASEAGSPSVPEYVRELIQDRVSRLIASIPPKVGAGERTDEPTVLTDDEETRHKVAPLIGKSKAAIRDGIGRLNLDRPPVSDGPPPNNLLRLRKN